GLPAPRPARRAGGAAVPPRPGGPPLRPPQRSSEAVEQPCGQRPRRRGACIRGVRTCRAASAPRPPLLRGRPRSAGVAGGETVCWFSREGEPCLCGALQALAEPVGHGVFRAGEPPVLGGEVLWGPRGFEGGF